MNFEELGLEKSILCAVTAEGYSVPTPIQAQAIPHVIAGRDVLGCAQTGTGKTAAFALPILHRLLEKRPNQSRPGRAIRVLVLSPTRELASQISDSFQTYGRHTAVRQTVIYGGVSQRPQVQSLRRGVDVLVATPGRLVDLINQGYVKLDNIEIFVLDEADRMLDMGFLPDLRKITAKLPKERQTLFFSATMPSNVEQLAHSMLSDPAQVQIAPQQATTDLVEQSVFFVPKPQKSRLLIHYMADQGVARAVVFTRTKHGADRVANHLNRAGIRTDAIHGNKSQAARQRTLSQFKMDRLRVLVATDLAARGIDVEGISHVFNYDLPHEPETYVHRIGRTGRAGASGIAVSFCDTDERSQLRAIERLIRQKIRVEQAPETAGISVTAAPSADAASEATGDNERGTRPVGERSSRRPGSSRRRPAGRSTDQKPARSSRPGATATGTEAPKRTPYGEGRTLAGKMGKPRRGNKSRRRFAAQSQ